MALNDATPFVHGIAVFTANNALGDGDTVKCALITASLTPTKGLTAPQWGAGLGGTDVSAFEVNGGVSTGQYTAGGKTCANVTVTENGDYSEIDFDNPSSWAQDPNNPTDARWAVFYNASSPTKECLGFYDLGSVHDMTGGDTTITVGASYFARVT